MNKIKLIENSNQISQIKNILTYLNTKSSTTRPIEIIVNELETIFSDNKVEIYEIPKLINLIHDSLYKINITNINSEDISLLIKILINLLTKTNMIKLSDKEMELTNQIIDSSLTLLTKSIEITNNKINKCVCF